MQNIIIVDEGITKISQHAVFVDLMERYKDLNVMSLIQVIEKTVFVDCDLLGETGDFL